MSEAGGPRASCNTDSITGRSLQCVARGSPIDRTEWHPVATRFEDGSRLYTFCRVACRQEWRDE